jgi:hypothetical protein
MHTSKGAGVKDRIKDVKHLPTNDPATRAGYMQKLKALYEELETVLRELTECEIATIKSLKKCNCKIDAEIKENIMDNYNHMGNDGRG